MSKVSVNKKESQHSENKESQNNLEEIKEEDVCIIEGPFGEKFEKQESTELNVDEIEPPNNSIPEENKSEEDDKFEDKLIPESVKPPPEEVKAPELPKEKDRAYKKIVDITNDELKLREYVINSKGVKAFLTSFIPDKAMKIGVNYPNYDGNGNYFSILENILKDASFKHVFRRQDKNIKKFDYLIDLFTLDDKIRNHGILKRVCLVKVVR